jgi:hypothetical protein
MTATIPEIPLFVQNDSGLSIPPRSVVVVSEVEITEATDTAESIEIWHVEQYTGQAGNILITGASTIAAPVSESSTPAESTTGWWSPNNSYGVAYSDQRIYIAIDPTVSPPLPGEVWGPVEGEWYVTRGGTGFVADGYPTENIPAGSSGSSSGISFPYGQLAIFYRAIGAQQYWGMIRSPVYPGTFSSPTTLTFDAWLPTPGTTLGPKPLAVSTVPSLVGMTVTNRFCFTVTNTSDSGSSGSSSGSISVPGRIEYDSAAGEWVLVDVGRCIQIATNVSCTSSGLSVTYGNVTG